MIVGDIDGLAGVRQSYLEAVAHGTEELVVELRVGCLGLDEPGMLAGVELADVGAREPPPIDVTLRAPDGLCVLAGIPLRIAARRLTIENVAIVGCTSAPIRISASAGVELRDVSALGSQSTTMDRAAVDLAAVGEAGTTLVLERSVFARNVGGDAALGVYSGSGAWFDDVRLDELTVDGLDSDAVVALEATRRLRGRAVRLRRGTARMLLRLLWPVVDGELAASTLSAPADGLLEVRQETPVAPKLRLTEGTIVTAPTGELPGEVEADESVVDAVLERADAAIDDAIAAAAARIVAVDARLERLVAR